MPPSRFCTTCAQNVQVEHDDAMGHVVCMGCGGVLEENAIVAEVGFMENAKGAAIAEGFSMGHDKGHSTHSVPLFFLLLLTKTARLVRKTQGGGGRAGRSLLSGQDSRDTTIQNGYRRIQEIAQQPQIKLRSRHTEQAERTFNLAVNMNFTKGRKLNHVAAACLYIACRYDKTAHMLIDFSDALSVNVYQLGATFLKLANLLRLSDLPIVDPALYISRFAARLEFGDDVQKIIKDANRIVQCMNRDWLQYGRRPAGICAAALWIAARMNGYNRTHREVVTVVKICEATLRKRLTEFSQTPSANMQVQDFEVQDIENSWLGEACDPPSFTAGKRKKAPGSDGEDNIMEEEESPEGLSSKKASGLDLDDNDEDEEGTQELLSELKDILGREDTQVVAKSNNVKGLLEDENEKLSDLDDDPEIQNIVSVSTWEAELKEALWTEENKDWILKQKLKAMDEAKGLTSVPRKRRKTGSTRQTLPHASNPAEATKNFLDTKPRTSKKINYDLLDNLFEVDEDDILRKQELVAKGELRHVEGSVTGFGRGAVVDEDEDERDVKGGVGKGDDADAEGEEEEPEVVEEDFDANALAEEEDVDFEAFDHDHEHDEYDDE
ncbi:cyclin-like protein [Fimicolochytrium jonesii]|uniref:cyclin-like protein n=1 Tax=Fimicolochytrium jonesii TaxID=1396493 RepID=UPI0022FEFC5E|nr:cyclin-like protein [Fimicolochytrium jonesii]KAI8816210.1 cyclin-like protein [Fimicolochytrium jonesii]